jgi:flavin-dependent dehydrogenase
MYDADVLIAGGGPAGLAAALHALRNGLSVVIAEPRSSPIDKACGEGLMPGGLAELAAIGVDPAGVPFRGIAYLDRKRRVEAPFRNGPGRGVRRTTLHDALVCAAKEAGAQWTSCRLTRVVQDAKGVAAQGIRARWLIAADGLHSPVRRALGIPAVAGSPRRYGVRWHFGTRQWSDFVEVHWSPWGEAYVTPVSPDVVGVAILTRHRRPDLAWFPWLAKHLRETPAGPARGGGPLRQTVARRVDGRVLLVGDAAGYEDALTGEGISLAVKQARAAISAIVAGQPQSYEGSWRRITRDYRLLTRGLVLATTPAWGRRAIVPASAMLPGMFRRAVNMLAA